MYSWCFSGVLVCMFVVVDVDVLWIKKKKKFLFFFFRAGGWGVVLHALCY